MLKKFAGRSQQATDKDSTPLLPTDGKHKQDWLAAAAGSECATNLDNLLKGLGRTPQEVGYFKLETWAKVYDALGAEVEGDDLARALVVRNEKFGMKTTCFLALITLGLFFCFRPRDDDTVLVLTKQGRVVQLKVERPSCCPAGAAAQFFVFAKYMAILFSIFVLPILVQCAITGRSVDQQLHELHLDWKGIEGFPQYANEHRVTVALTLAAAVFWIGSLIPHDYRDRYRRRHMAREVAAGQYKIWGWSCCRRSSMRLFFGNYPNQAVLDLGGTLGNSACCGPVPPGSLISKGRPSASAIIVGLTIFISSINLLDTAITWGERSLALEHAAEMQAFCTRTNSEEACALEPCQAWTVDKRFNIAPTFCQEIYWETEKDIDCLRLAKKAPCCLGCNKGTYEDFTDEGTMATFKSLLSLLADVGTLLFTFTAARYALGFATASDYIDVLIKRRSKNAVQMETAKFDNTHPVCMDFMEHIFGIAGRRSAAAGIPSLETHGTVALDGDDGTKWSGVNNYELDNVTKDWEDYFAQELLVALDCRWTSKVKVPAKALGIAADEKVLAAWAELPLIPFNMSFLDFVSGGVLYDLLPFGTTRHAVIVTTRRVFYVRYRRPKIPLKFFGVALRVDCFRHDQDVWFGLMFRTKSSFLHKLIHEKIMREHFLPGVVAFQTRFGALQIARSHGDAIDVYHLVCQLSKNTSEFIDPDVLVKNGISWDRCQDKLETSLRKKSSTLYAIEPQPDDTVEPKPDIHLSHKKEQLVFHASFRDIGSTRSGRYTNTDVVITTGRVFFWQRDVYKKFDCQACCYWLCWWRAFLNPIFASRNLPNSCSFVTLPSLLSFSTDLSIDPPSWFEPHHQPLKCPCFEWLTHSITRCCLCERSPPDDAPPPKGRKCCSFCPRRSGPSATAKLMWRLRQSAHADNDFIIENNVRPFFAEEAPESDAEDIYNGLGLGSDQLEESRRIQGDQNHEEMVETMRKIMCVVQDQSDKILDKIEVMY